ncbi:MAG: glycosyltransferase family 4 protein [Deltaproteobacteria bacterium]|nr:glycosyltransferase family 4 protein [Deltaproteobacteria bacterium]
MNPTSNAAMAAPPAATASAAPLPSSAMRILYLNYEWDARESSGAARHLAELTRELRSLGHTVVTCDRHRAPDPAPGGEPGRDHDWLRLLRARLSPRLHESAALARAVRGIAPEIALIRRHQPDVVLTRHSLHQFSSLIAARRCGIPIVFEVNAPLAHEYRRYLRQYRLLPQLAEWSEAQTLARADGVFVVSNALKRYFAAHGVMEERISVIPNGVDPARFNPAVADAEVRARLGHDRVIVAFVGSFASFHGVELLRQAIVEVLPRRLSVTFLMVGSSPLSAALQGECRARGYEDRVEFAGFVPPQQVPKLMAAADILLAPYAAEEFFYLSPIKLFEYLACGRAVLTARQGQMAEVVADGENGLLYDPRSPNAFIAQLLRLIDDPMLRARLGFNGRRTVERGYTWKTNAERVAAVLSRAGVRVH